MRRAIPSWCLRRRTPSAPDYPKLKKDYDEFQAQAAREPLALKLADSVGHTRIATNFSWTLLTGYLVLFMQAGFALLTVRAGAQEKCRTFDDAELRGVRVCVPCLLRDRLRLSVWRSGAERGSGESGGAPTLNHFLIGSGSWGFLGGKGFFLTGPAYDVSSNCLTLFEVVFMETAGYIIVGAICERITFWAFLLCELFVGGILVSDIWVLGLGWRLALAVQNEACIWAMDMWILRARSVVHSIGGFCAMALAIILGPRLGKYGADGKPRAFPASKYRFCSKRYIYIVVWVDGI